jgi:hypothetical protein
VACDRFVSWNTERRPTREEVASVIVDFCGGAATEVKWERDRFFVLLVGTTSAPLKRIPGVAPLVASDDGGERWLEVWFDDESLDVLTRHQDEFTHAVALGLAKVFARFWDGKLEM